MKTSFSKKFIKSHCGCYDAAKLKNIGLDNFKDEEQISIEEIMSCSIPLNHKYHFVFHYSGLNSKEIHDIVVYIVEKSSKYFEPEHSMLLWLKEAKNRNNGFIGTKEAIQHIHYCIHKANYNQEILDELSEYLKYYY